MTAILARILALKQTRVLAVHVEPEGVLLDVAPDHRFALDEASRLRVCR